MTLRAGFLGAGEANWKRGSLLQTLDENGNLDWEIAAFCDLSSEKSERAVARFGGAIYSSVGRMLANEKLDAVFVAIPAGARGPAESAILKSGCALFLEYPVGISARTFAALGVLSKRLGVPAMVNAPWRYDSNLERARRALANKTFAPIIANGFLSAPLGDEAWRQNPAQSGGLWLETAWPLLDLARLLGDEMRVSNLKTGAEAGNLLLIAKNGALWNLSAAQSDVPSSRLEIWGRETRLSIEDFAAPRVEIESDGEARAWAPQSGEIAQLEAFGRLLSQGKRLENRATLAEALSTLKLAPGARK